MVLLLRPICRHGTPLVVVLPSRIRRLSKRKSFLWIKNNHLASTYYEVGCMISRPCPLVGVVEVRGFPLPRTRRRRQPRNGRYSFALCVCRRSTLRRLPPLVSPRCGSLAPLSRRLGTPKVGVVPFLGRPSRPVVLVQGYRLHRTPWCSPLGACVLYRVVRVRVLCTFPRQRRPRWGCRSTPRAWREHLPRT